MYCKNCDKLIDDDERVCHYCNHPSQRQKRKPKTQGKHVLIAALIFVFLVGAPALFIIVNTQSGVVNNWHEITMMPDLEYYETVTIAELNENSQAFMGKHVRVAGQVVDTEIITPIVGRHMFVIIKEDDELADVRIERDNFNSFELNSSYWFYGTFTGSHIAAHIIVPIN